MKLTFDVEKAEKENKDLYIQACLERRRTFYNTNVDSRSLSVVKYIINNVLYYRLSSTLYICIVNNIVNEWMINNHDTNIVFGNHS